MSAMATFLPITNMDKIKMNGFSSSCHYTNVSQNESTRKPFTVPIEEDVEPEKRETLHQKDGRKDSLKKYPASQERQEIIICLVFAVFNCISIVLICILAAIISNENTVPEPVAEFCFSRNLIEGHPYDSADQKLCFQNLNSTGEIIQKITSRWLKEKILNDTSRKFRRYDCGEDMSNKAGTIKLLAPKIRTRRATDNCVLWDDECKGKTILPNTTTYYKFHKEQGYIEIMIPGMYHVYSQINIHYTLNGGNILQNFFHIVVSKKDMNLPSENLLMRSSNSQCACKNDTQLFSSYLGSDFYLHKGDKLAVKVYEDSIQSMESDSNLIGILKL